MSIFKTSGIVLKKNRLKENEDLINVFSESYGKLTLKVKKSKKEKSLDLGYTINFEVDVKKENSINEMKNIKIKNELEYNKYNYEEIFEYLELINFIEKNSPLNMEINGVFEIIFKINACKNLTLEKLLFCKIKLIHIYGLLKEDFPNENLKKVINFIKKNNIDDILKLSGLKDFEIKLLKEKLTF